MGTMTQKIGFDNDKYIEEQSRHIKERIAQLVVAPFLKASFAEADELSDTVRGEGGFGSTGRK